MSKRDRTFVSVVVPVYDDYPRLQETVEALEAQSYASGDYEVVVVDNGTPAHRIVDLESAFEHVRMTSESKQGSYAARNAGIEAAEGDLFAFTDADCLPAEGWLAAGVEALEADESVGLVGGPIDLFARDEDAPTLAELWELRRGFPQREYVEEMNFSATANMFTRRRVFDDVGRFDDDLQSGGDREFGERVAAAGYRQEYTPAARVRHPARHALRDLLKKTVRTTRGDYRRREQHGEFSPPTRLLRMARAAGDIAIGPLKAAVTAATEPGSCEERAKFAVTDELVSAARELVAIEQLGGHLLGRG